MTFKIATNLEYYGSGVATETDVQEYIDFARAYLGSGYEIEVVSDYPHGEDDDERNLRERVWEAFCRS